MRKNSLSGAEKGGEYFGEDKFRFVQTLIKASDHKDLKRAALEREVSLAIMLREIIENYLKQQREE